MYGGGKSNFKLSFEWIIWCWHFEYIGECISDPMTVFDWLVKIRYIQLEKSFSKMCVDSDKNCLKSHMTKRRSNLSSLWSIFSRPICGLYISPVIRTKIGLRLDTSIKSFVKSIINESKSSVVWLGNPYSVATYPFLLLIHTSKVRHVFKIKICQASNWQKLLNLCTYTPSFLHHQGDHL